MPRHLREDFLVGSSQVDPSSAMPLLDFLFGAPTPPTRSRARIYIYIRNFVIGRLVYGGNRKVAKEELISLSGGEIFVMRGRYCEENGEFGMLIEIFFLFSGDRVLNYSRLFGKLCNCD